MILEGQFRDRATVAIKIHCHRKNGWSQPGNQVGDHFTGSSSECLHLAQHGPSEKPPSRKTHLCLQTPVTNGKYLR